MIKNYLIILCCALTFQLSSQDFNIGLRAGTNFNTFLGPTEIDETTSISNGFHFGLNFQYNFSDVFGLRSELLYIQNGKKTKYEGPSYHIFNTGDGIIYDNGEALFTLKVSNANISLPITAHYELSRKFEVFAGGYVNFLIGPRGSGVLEYISTDNPDGIDFIQSHDYNYYSDDPGQANFIATPIVLILNGETYSLPRIVGAYYQQSTKIGNKYKTIDVGLTAGTNYYFNPGFYMGVRAEYGFRDLTNDQMDISLRSLDANNDFVRLQDNDRHFGIQVSLGFRF